MHYALIDMGSNTIHLCVYDVNGKNYRKLFQRKEVVGLAGYVEDHMLTREGIHAACETLVDFKDFLNALKIEKVDVFATAALRNVRNTEDAREAISRVTGFNIQVLSGEQEAMMGYYGLMQVEDISEGVLLDIGGGSAEVTVFSNRKTLCHDSFPIGSLNLYKNYVGGHIIPSEKERELIKKRIKNIFSEENLSKYIKYKVPMYAIGGSARAVLKLANHHFNMDEDNRKIKRKQLKELREYICDRSQDSLDLLLRYCPDRMHTIIPGLMILEVLSKKFDADEISINQIGVREGYLWYKLSGEGDREMPVEIANNVESSENSKKV